MRVGDTGVIHVPGDPNSTFLDAVKEAGMTDSGAPVDPAAPLPVAQRLPDGQGWVIAQYGAGLAYRLSPDGPWQDAGTNAALLPDNAAQVRVTKDGTEKVIDLAR